MDHSNTPKEPLTAAPVVIAAFEGWSDAGEAATVAIDHLLASWDLTELATLDPDTYYDYQNNRPIFARTDDGAPFIDWPSTRIYQATSATLDREVYIIRGIEPSFRWRAFTAELLDHICDTGADTLIMLGAMHADTPHTRPLPVTSSTTDEHLMKRLALEPSNYEGPTGIVGIIMESARRRNITPLSLWVSVPSYVTSSPSPKASLALLNRVEELLEVPIPFGELPEEALAWESAVSELAESDDDIAEHVIELESETNTQDLPEASGDAIARDFSRYLRRRS